MMRKITIDKNVPLPVKVSREVYPFRQMEIGDSFLIAIIGDKNVYTQKQKVYLAKWRFCQRNPNKKFTTSTVSEGLRVWRIQ